MWQVPYDTQYYHQDYPPGLDPSVAGAGLLTQGSAKFTFDPAVMVHVSFMKFISAVDNPFQ